MFSIKSKFSHKLLLLQTITPNFSVVKNQGFKETKSGCVLDLRVSFPLITHKEGLYFSNQENIPAIIFTCQSLLKILKTHPHSFIQPKQTRNKISDLTFFI